MTRAHSSCSWILALAGIALAGTQASAQVTGGPGASQILDQQLRDYTLQHISLPGRIEPFFTTRAILDGQEELLLLWPHSQRAGEFRLLVQGTGGNLVETEPPPVRTYHGQVAGRPGSRVRAFLGPNGTLTAGIWLDRGDEDSWEIQPRSDFEGAATPDPTEHVVFRGNDFLGGTGGTCGVVDAGGMTPPREEGGTVQKAGPSGMKTIDIAFDTDVEYYQSNGSSVAATLYDIEKVMDRSEDSYELYTNLTQEITFVIVRTAEPDPYTSTNASTMLNEFDNYWSANLPNVHRDVAHFMTGKNMNGSTIGIAWVSCVCTKGCSYGVSQSHFTVAMKKRGALTSHEMGHNFNAKHCDGQPDCHIMCSGLGGCAGLSANPAIFGSSAITKITNKANASSCIKTDYDPLPAPFHDSFQTASIDPNLWSYDRDGQVAVNGLGIGIPSDLYAAELDAGGSAIGWDDDLRTSELLLSGESGQFLSYFTERRGVEAGEELVVEYYNNDFTWVELNRLTSDGIDESSFTFHQHALPADAYHDAFRARFRVEVDETNDDWYLDDVSVSNGLVITQSSGLAGTTNTYLVNGATPGQAVFFIGGFTPAAIPLPGCPGTNLGILELIIMAAPVADANGRASLPLFIPPGVSGITFLVEALEYSSCRVTNTIQYTFP